MIQKCTIRPAYDITLHPDRDASADNQRAAYDQLAAFTDQLVNLLDAWDSIPMDAIEWRIGRGAVQVLNDLIGQQLVKR